MVVQKKFRKNEKKKQLIGGISNNTLLYIIGGVIVGLILLMFLFIILRKPTSTSTEVDTLKNKITNLLDQVNTVIPKFTSTDRTSLNSYIVTSSTSNQYTPKGTTWRGIMPKEVSGSELKSEAQYMLLVRDV